MNLHEKLFKAIEEHSGLEKDEIIQAGEHGADAGWNGFIYYHETAKFFQDNKGAIIDLVKQMTDDVEEANMISFIASFNCLDDNTETLDEIGRAIYGSPNKDDYLVTNALAWFALEEVGRWLESLQERFTTKFIKSY